MHAEQNLGLIRFTWTWTMTRPASTVVFRWRLQMIKSSERFFVLLTFLMMKNDPGCQFRWWPVSSNDLNVRINVGFTCNNRVFSTFIPMICFRWQTLWCNVETYESMLNVDCPFNKHLYVRRLVNLWLIRKCGCSPVWLNVETHKTYKSTISI